jgi:thiamine monophosphate kinase
LALHGGDDYELLFTVPRAKASKMLHSFQGVQLTRIGCITSGSGIFLKEEGGHLEKFEAGGWDPFRK